MADTLSKILGPRNSTIAIWTPSIMLEKGTSLAEQPFNGESMYGYIIYVVLLSNNVLIITIISELKKTGGCQEKAILKKHAKLVSNTLNYNFI